MTRFEVGLERQRIGLRRGHHAGVNHREAFAMLHLAERAAVRHRQQSTTTPPRIISVKMIRMTVLRSLLPPGAPSAWNAYVPTATLDRGPRRFCFSSPRRRGQIGQ